jgi:hypothetical protein
VTHSVLLDDARLDLETDMSAQLGVTRSSPQGRVELPYRMKVWQERVAIVVSRVEDPGDDDSVDEVACECLLEQPGAADEKDLGGVPWYAFERRGNAVDDDRRVGSTQMRLAVCQCLIFMIDHHRRTCSAPPGYD